MARTSTAPDLLLLARLVLGLSRAIERDVERTLRPAVGLSATEYLVLRAIQDGSAYPTAVAARLNLPPASVSRTLDRLEARGWLRRATDFADLRRSLLSLTPSGSELVAKARELLRAQLEYDFDHVPNGVLHASIGELETLLAAMEAREAR